MSNNKQMKPGDYFRAGIVVGVFIGIIMCFVIDALIQYLL